ncbi:MAG: HupE/UreJ family protein [Thiolinea sp.]
MPADELAAEFSDFQTELLQRIWLRADQQPVTLRVAAVDIPEPGYTKVPRASVIVLEGQIAPGTRDLQWYYPAAFGDNAVRVRQVNEAKEEWHWSDWQWIRRMNPASCFPEPKCFRSPPIWEVAWSYAEIGFTRIMPKGLDHILFILGIFLFSARLRPLFWQVTMFTIAHTITLGLSMNGILSLPAKVVEPLIALSIAYVGVENLWARHLHKSRLLLVFALWSVAWLGFCQCVGRFWHAG